MKRVFSKVTAVIVAIAVALSTMGTIDWLSINSATNVFAAATTITSMECYDSANGPVIKREGVGEASFGFVMPKFNGKTSKELSISDVEKDLQVYVKQAKGTSGEWKKLKMLVISNGMIPGLGNTRTGVAATEVGFAG